MNIDFTDAEMKAVARFLEPFSDLEVELMSAWLKLVRAQAQQVTAPTTGPTTVGAVNDQAQQMTVPTPAATMPLHSPPGVGAVNNDGDWGFR